MSVRRPPTAVSERAREEGFGEPVDGIGGRSEMLLTGVGGPLLFGGIAYVVSHFHPRSWRGSSRCSSVPWSGG